MDDENFNHDQHSEVNEEIKDRIKFEVVGDVYDEWLKRGLDGPFWDVLDGMDVDKSPVIHSWITHVHKEKGLFLDLIGDSRGVTEEIRKPLAMSADLLWTLSLIVDDIEDADVIRGGMETAWKKYGKQDAMDSATDCLQTLLKYLAVKTNDRKVAYNGSQYVQMGLDSLEEHKKMTLNTPIGEIIKNYERRCDFHATYQLMEMGRLSGKESEMQRAAVGLRQINQAGQLINDLKDFIGKDLYLRGFSDIARGVVTVPIEYMIDGLGSVDKSRFGSIFGKPLDAEGISFLTDAIESSGVVERTLNRVEDYYNEGLTCVKKIVTPDNYSWFDRWCSYKVSSLKESVENHE